MSNDVTPPPMPAYDPPSAPKKSRTNAIIIGSATAVIAAIIGTGIVVVQARDDDKPQATAEISAPADDTVTAAVEEEATPEDTEPAVMGLTDGVSYEDGVELSLSDYKRGTSSAWAAPENTPYVAFTVKIDNKSESVVDIGTGYVMCYYGDDSQESEQIFDDGLDGLPSMKLRPGRTAKAKVACEMPKSEEYLQVEVSPSMDDETAIFAGNVK
ncbi:hypothetical protein ACFY1L_13790 [Streptomyces sp. NPDC001663]|uniref:hypothetical protein n=1 Tax=Streptomyces sp. NPDC001663 TaxID=3364597 RepID=UPI0036994E3F